MTESNLLYVDKIPDGTNKLELKRLFDTLTDGRYEIKHILFPLGLDSSRAYIQFSEYPEILLKPKCQALLNGHRLDISAGPFQVFSTCSAVVDALLIGILPDVRDCIDIMKSEFGLLVDESSGDGQLTLTGSIYQLTYAQQWLLEEYIWHYRQQMQMLSKQPMGASGHDHVGSHGGHDRSGFQAHTTCSCTSNDDVWNQHHGRQGEDYYQHPSSNDSRRTAAPGLGRRDDDDAKQTSLTSEMSDSSGRHGEKSVQGVGRQAGSVKTSSSDVLPERRSIETQQRVDRDGMERKGQQEKAQTTVDLDYYVVGYLLRCQILKVDRIERKFRVKIAAVNRVCEDILTVSFQQQGLLADVTDQEEKARDAFVSLVQKAYGGLVQKTIRDEAALSSHSEQSKLIQDIHKVYLNVFVAGSEEDPATITLVGSFEEVHSVNMFIVNMGKKKKVPTATLR